MSVLLNKTSYPAWFSTAFSQLNWIHEDKKEVLSTKVAWLCLFSKEQTPKILDHNNL